MSVIEKLDLLKDSYADEAELDRVLARLLEVVLNQHRLRLARYEQELRGFEARFGMASTAFAARFGAGELGDDLDYFIICTGSQRQTSCPLKPSHSVRCSQS